MATDYTQGVFRRVKYELIYEGTETWVGETLMRSLMNTDRSPTPPAAVRYTTPYGEIRRLLVSDETIDGRTL
jgi:hypothetical protein